MKKNKLKLILFSIILLMVLTACGGEDQTSAGDSTESNSEDPIVLKVSSGLNEQQTWFESHFNPWMDRVEEETNGKVQFDVYLSGELVEIGSELDALNSGLIDIALPLFSLYDQGRFPISEVTMLPTIKSDPEIMNKAFYSLMYDDVELKDGQSFYDLEIASKDLKMWPAAMGGAYSISTTGEPFETIEELQQLKIRTATRLTEVFINNVGATAITMPQTDAFEALSRGALDGNTQTIGDWISFGYQDLYTYTLEGVNLGHFNAIIGMTKETWESLPEDVQNIMDIATEEIVLGEHVLEVADQSVVDVKEIATENGAIFESFEDKSPELQETINEAMLQTWYDWIELVENDGHPGKAVAKLWRDLIIEAGGEVPVGLELD